MNPESESVLRLEDFIGIASPIVIFLCVAGAIWMSPWFSWELSALSDLGHPIRSSAPLFNFGLFAGGQMIVIFGVLRLLKARSMTSSLLVDTGFTLQLVGVFSEAYGRLHTLVSTLLFLWILFTMVGHFIETRRRQSLMFVSAFFLEWTLYFTGVYGGGVAVPETISGLTATAWLYLLIGWGKGRPELLRARAMSE